MQAAFNLLPETSSQRRRGRESVSAPSDEAQRTFKLLLRSELFGADLVDSSPSRTPSSQRSPSFRSRSSSRASTPSSRRLENSAEDVIEPAPRTSRPVFAYTPPRKRSAIEPGGTHGLDNPTHQRYSSTPAISTETQKLLQPSKNAPRSISRVPYKVLDAPNLADDYYLNLIDWSSTNTLAVGLGSDVYLWSGLTSKVTRLCQLGASAIPDSVTSVQWIGKGDQLAVGTKNGLLYIYDAVQLRLIRTMTGHSARIGALAWNGPILSSGSHDKKILHRDVRVAAHSVGKITSHRQEVCGLKWSAEGAQLASGGNDNQLFVFEKTNETPTYRFTNHTAAVKALAWSPHQRGILASGGGTADMRLCFRNTSTGGLVSEVATGSQICNLAWSQNSNELVSTHGFSAGQAQNQVTIWRYGAQVQQVATLQGHSYRVLYLATSPDGRTIVTGAADETLRFWDAFPPKESKKQVERSLLNPLVNIR